MADIVCWFWCLAFLFVVVRNTDAARVETHLGSVEGTDYQTHSGKSVYTFLGIPFAQPPVGRNRFEEPKHPNSWTGVREAKKQSPPCAQFNSIVIDNPNKIMGDEDCLYLNVYTPSLTNTSNLPVLVYIHGGGFMAGNSAGSRPDYLLDQIDLVLVSIQYRLGPFGFLSTEDNVVPGNNGLKDQVFALKWVQENIARFGGNKSEVTISGTSAGGASVQYHFLSELSRGTFHRGISSSGSALMPWALIEKPLQKAKQLANALGCTTITSKEMIKCLKFKPSTAILSLIEPLYMPWLYNPISPFGPVIENITNNTFLNKQPYELLKSGDIYHGPWLVSMTTEEGLFPGASFINRFNYLKSLSNGWLKIAPYLLDYNFTIPFIYKKKSVAVKVRRFYFGRKEISPLTGRNLVEMLGDRLFKSDMNLAIRTQASVSPFPVYFLMFGYRGNISGSDDLSKTKLDFGVTHSDDIYFVLKPGKINTMRSETDQAMVKTMSKIWTSFIQTGLPCADNTVQWDPVSRDSAFSKNVTYLFISRRSELVTSSDTDYGNKRFWSSLGFLENEHYM